jgi:hypothetical protein
LECKLIALPGALASVPARTVRQAITTEQITQTPADAGPAEPEARGQAIAKPDSENSGLVAPAEALTAVPARFLSQAIATEETHQVPAQTGPVQSGLVVPIDALTSAPSRTVRQAMVGEADTNPIVSAQLSPEKANSAGPTPLEEQGATSALVAPVEALASAPARAVRQAMVGDGASQPPVQAAPTQSGEPQPVDALLPSPTGVEAPKAEPMAAASQTPRADQVAETKPPVEPQPEPVQAVSEPQVAESRPAAPSADRVAETKPPAESQPEPAQAVSEPQVAESRANPESDEWNAEGDSFDEWVRDLAEAESEQHPFAESEPAAPPEAPATPSPDASSALVHADQPAAPAEPDSPQTAAEPEPPRRVMPDEGSAKSDENGAARSLMDFESRPITSLTVNIGPKAGEKPTDYGREQLARMQAKPADAVFARNWPMVCFQWEAPSLAYRPLYFEEVNLERFGYGMKYMRAAQPIISAGQFFTTVPILPYKMFAEPARTPVYTLGHYRPGSDVPFRPVYPPLSISGATVQAGAAVGLIFVIP